MILGEFLESLERNPNAKLSFLIDQGAPIPPHFHVTEVGRIDKSFIDCGGTLRAESNCQLQVWVAHDVDHRLLSGKLARIIRMAEPLLKSNDLPVEIEYGEDAAARYEIESISHVFGTLQIHLNGRRTDCLAKDKCGVGDSANCCG